MGIQGKDDNKSSSFNKKSNRNLKVKSNSTVTSTLDMFDINVKQAKKDIDNIFNYATDSTTQFNSKIESQFRKTTNNLLEIHKEYQDKINRQSKNLYRSISQSMISHNKNAYDKMYKDAQSYYSRIKSLNNSNSYNNINNAVQQEMSIVVSKQELSDSYNTESTLNITNALFDKSIFKQSIFNDVVINAKDSNLFTAIKSSANSAIESNENKIKADKDNAGLLESIVSGVASQFKSALRESRSIYDSTYNTIATRSGLSEIQNSGGKIGFSGDMYYGAMNSVNFQGLEGIINYKKDLIPAIESAAKQGFKGDELVSKATNDAIANKLMPWLDTQSEAWTNMSYNMSDATLSQIKGQQLILQETKSGNRLLQSGVINSLTQTMEPLLRNIDYNTGGADNLTSEAYALLQSFTDSGLSENEAYSSVQKIIEAKKNPIAAYNSGDPATILAMNSIMNNNGSLSGVAELIQENNRKVSNMNNDIDSSAYWASIDKNGIFNPSSAKTVNSSRSLTDILDKYNKNLEDYTSKTPDEQKQYYKKQLDNSDKFVTTNEYINNLKDNFETYNTMMTAAMTASIGIQSGILASLNKADIANGINKLTSKIPEDSKLKSLLSKISGKMPTTSTAMNAGTGLGGSTASSSAGTLKTLLSSTTMKSALGAGGLLWAGVDAIRGTSKANEWFAEKNNGEKANSSQKVASAIGGAVGGTDSGLSGMVKGAGKGALIGSFFGPVGTAIGAGVGGIFGAVGGKNIAKGLNAFGEGVKDLGTSIGKGVGDIANAVKDGAKANIEAVSKVGTSLINGYSEVSTSILNSTSSLIESTTDASSNVIKGFSDVGVSIIDGFGTLTSSMSDGASSFIDGIADTAGGIFKIGGSIVGNIGNKINNFADSISGKPSNNMTDTISTSSDVVALIEKSNEELSSNIVAGMQSSTDRIIKVLTAIYSLMKNSNSPDILDNLNFNTNESSVEDEYTRFA